MGLLVLNLNLFLLLTYGNCYFRTKSDAEITIFGVIILYTKRLYFHTIWYGNKATLNLFTDVFCLHNL